LTSEEFRRAVEEEQLRSERGGGSFSVLLLDVDAATGIYDAQAVLEIAAQHALQRVRLTDRVACLPGQVAMLLPNTSERGAQTLANELMENWSNGFGSGTRLTVSSFPSSGDGRNGYPWANEDGELTPRIAAPEQAAFSPRIQAREARLGPLGAKAPIPIWKRASDLIGAAIALVGLAPFMFLIGLYIWIVDRGPVLFTQERVGFSGHSFKLIKFRTMKQGKNEQLHRMHAEQFIKANSVMSKVDGELRMIPLAGLLRRSGLDELPQLVNVLRGDMSLVGPRPCIPYEAQAYRLWHRRRLDVLPGITGLWQVSGRNRLSFDEMVRLDVRYANRLSAWRDLVLVLRTPVTIVQELLDTLPQQSDSEWA
jgi:lipopolysaccharide/colanic/teichoic acid biosynthesis glycosyltransferase